MEEAYKKWTINLEEKLLVDEDGLIVKFEEPEPGTLEGEIQNPEALNNENDVIPIIQDAGRALLAEMKKQRDAQS